MDDVVPARRARRARRRGDADRRRAAALPGRGRDALPVPRRRAARSGVIASVTQPFCGDCTRARLSAEGRFYTCLFTGEGHDLRAVLRDPPAEASGRRRDPARRDRARSGGSATIATPRSGPRRRPRACPGSRCSRWAGLRHAPSARGATRCPRDVHTGGELVDTRPEAQPAIGGQVSLTLVLDRARIVGLARRGLQEPETPRSHQGPPLRAGRFGRFVARPRRLRPLPPG